jgi:hypothetical protein
MDSINKLLGNMMVYFRLFVYDEFVSFIIMSILTPVFLYLFLYVVELGGDYFFIYVKLIYFFELK